MLTPIWKQLFNGCCLNRATDKWILESFEWAEKKSKSCSVQFSILKVLIVAVSEAYTVDFETQQSLDVKSYGWARKPYRS